MWIGIADSLPRKAVVDGEINSMKTKTTNVYSDFNADIKIEPPM